VIGAFLAVAGSSQYAEATASGLAYFALAAEKATMTANGRKGPGAFKAELLDQLYKLTPKELEKGAKITKQ